MATTGAKKVGRPSTKPTTVNTENVEITEAVTEVVTPKNVTERKYQPEDTILCRSITGGFTNFRGRKSGNVYNFLDNGDTAEIEYGDLRAAMLSRSQYIYDPVFVIEDEELLSQHEWAGVKKVYEGLYTSSNLEDVLRLPTDEMRDVIVKMPVGGKRSIATLARNLIDSGEFDSMNKIKVLDEVLGTDLALQFA